MEQACAKGRVAEIDIAKGMACFLMIAAHFISARLLPFGTFAAPLFFACSGMNTILLVERTRDNRRYDLFHLLFPVLLFLGGSTYTVLSHGGRLRLAPGFLQIIALAVLLLFGLSRIFRNPLHAGLLFPVPFLIQQLLPLSVLRSTQGSPLAFAVGKDFALAPWLGFFLFGVLLLALKRHFLPWLLAASAAAFVLCHAAAGVPIHKYWMSSSYIFLSLAAVVLAFAAARLLAGLAARKIFRGLAEFFALPGRNSLMFIYLHFVALRLFVSVDFLPWFGLYLFFETLYLFFVCFAFLKIYEKVRHEAALFFPLLAVAAALAVLRWGGLLRPRTDLGAVDVMIGILFAFLYVLLRRRAAAFCGRGPSLP